MGSNANSVVIELDWPPVTLDPLLSGDYSERCVVSALHRPVLRLLSASRSHDRFEFAVEGGCRFSDGMAVRGDHVLATLIRSASAPLWARYISYLEKAEVSDDRICLTMRRPAVFFPDLLQAIDFAPTHPDGHLGNGPYRMGGEFDSDQKCFVLTPNSYFPGAAERPELVFTVHDDVDGAPERFGNGETDITCSTAFPLDRLHDWQGSAALHRAPSGIYMQLEPNLVEGAPLAEPAVRGAMLACLDLAEIARGFAGGLRPTAASWQAPTMRYGIMPSHIRISYNDFYPNRQVLEKLSLQWEAQLGIQTELVERDYTDLSRDDVDASFVLRYPAFRHPYAFFDQCAMLSRDATFERLLRRFAAGEQRSGDDLAGRLRTTVPILRFFEVIGHWLANPQVVGFCWPSDAVFDFTDLRRRDGCAS